MSHLLISSGSDVDQVSVCGCQTAITTKTNIACHRLSVTFPIVETNTHIRAGANDIDTGLKIQLTYIVADYINVQK